MIDNRTWLLRWLDATSQWLNAFFLGGDPNECISGRCWREQRMIYKSIDWLFWVIRGEVNHCQNAYRKDNKWAGKRLRMIRTFQKEARGPQ